MYFVYVLISEQTGRRYIGSCLDLQDRLGRHNRGESKSTKHGVPWRLVYYEEFRTRAEAVGRERYLKSGKGREDLDAIFSEVIG